MPQWLKRVLRSPYVMKAALVVSGACAGLSLQQNYSARQSACTFFVVGALLAISHYEVLLRRAAANRKLDAETIQRYADGSITMLRQIDQLLADSVRKNTLIVALSRDLDSARGREQDGGMH